MTKQIIVVKIPCKLLYQKIKLSVPQLIHTYLFTMLHTISIVNLINLKLNFDKLRPAIFCNFHYRVIHQYRVCI